VLGGVRGEHERQERIVGPLEGVGAVVAAGLERAGGCRDVLERLGDEGAVDAHG
jgi:hypothetical protein